MVKGLEIFRVWFKDYADQYVLIGGTAAWVFHGIVTGHFTLS